MKYVEPVRLLIVIALATMSFAMSPTDDGITIPSDKVNELVRQTIQPVELDLQLGLSSPDSGQATRVILVGIVNNHSADATTLSSYPSTQVSVYAVRRFEDQADKPVPSFGPQTLRLHSRGAANPLTVTVAKGESARVLELDLVEILGQSPDRRGADSDWGWDWPSRTRPPVSPLFPNRFGGQSRTVTQISIWFEVTVDGSPVQSNVLKIPVVLPQP